MELISYPPESMDKELNMNIARRASKSALTSIEIATKIILDLTMENESLTGNNVERKLLEYYKDCTDDEISRARDYFFKAQVGTRPCKECSINVTHGYVYSPENKYQSTSPVFNWDYQPAYVSSVIYCSVECLNMNQSRPRQCLLCNTEFKIRSHDSAWRNNFCSMRCQGTWTNIFGSSNKL